MKQTKAQRDLQTHYCNHCKKEYIPAIIQRTYGKESMVALLGYCSAECYTKSLQLKETSISNDSLEWVICGTNYMNHVMICEKGKEDSTPKIAHVIYNGEENVNTQWMTAKKICEAVNNYNALKEELESWKQEHFEIVEQASETIKELQSVNKELQSVNKELQSVNKELIEALQDMVYSFHHEGAIYDREEWKNKAVDKAKSTLQKAKQL